MRGESTVDGVSEQWIRDYSGIHTEAEVPVKLSNFFTKEPVQLEHIVKPRPEMREVQDFFDDPNSFYSKYHNILDQREAARAGDIELQEFRSDGIDAQGRPRAGSWSVEEEDGPAEEKYNRVEQERDPFLAEPYSEEILESNRLSDQVVRDMVREFPDYSNVQLLREMKLNMAFFNILIDV